MTNMPIDTTAIDEERPRTPGRDRYVRAVVLMDTLGGRPGDTDEDLAVVEGGVVVGALPDGVLDDRRDRRFDVDNVRGFLRGFEEARDRIEDSRYPSRSVEEELFRLEYNLTDRIRSIDHSGRGSGCCQSEYGLKKKREAVRWILTGEWGFAL